MRQLNSSECSDVSGGARLSTSQILDFFRGRNRDNNYTKKEEWVSPVEDIPTGDSTNVGIALGLGAIAFFVTAVGVGIHALTKLSNK